MAFAGELRRADLALGAALAEAARHQDAVDVLEERRRVFLLEHLGLDPVEIDLHLVGDAAVRQRLGQRFVGVLHAGVFADDGDRHLAFRIADALVDELPARQVRPLAGIEPECGEHLGVEALGRIGLRHRVDVVDVARLDHCGLAHVAEQRQLAALFLRDFAVGAAQQNVGLDADREQFLDRVLGGLGLQLARARNVRHQREVNVDRVLAWQFVAELADRFEERQALDVADRAADLHQHEIDAVVAVADEILDGVGDMRDHLNRGAEIIAAPLLGEDVLVDAAGGDVVALGRRIAGEALVMAEVEIGLGAVVGDEHLAVLIGRHRARVDVEVGIELAEPDGVAARLQAGAERRRRETLAQ